MAIPPFGSPPTPDASGSRKGKIKLTGDLAGTADSPALAPTGSSGTFGDSTHTLTVTTDSKGRVTSISANPISVSSPTQRTFAYFTG